MEPPRHEEGMDPELAAALGIQISDERTQEANVLGARLATGVSAPPLALAFLGNGFFDGKDAFPEEALDKLIGLAGDGDRASVLRAALSAVGDDALAAAVLRAALQKERPAAVEPEPVVEQPRMSLRDHRRAERQRAMANRPRNRRAGARGRGPSRRSRDAWLRRRTKGADAWRPLGAAQPAKRRRRAPAPAPAPAAPTSVACPICGVRVAVADPRRPDAEMDAHLERCGRRRPGAPLWMRKSPTNPTATRPRTREARSSCAPRRPHRTMRTTLLHRTTTVRCGCDLRKRSPTTAPTMH